MDETGLVAMWENARRGDSSAKKEVVLALAERLSGLIQFWHLGRGDPDLDEVLDEAVLRLLQKLQRGETVADPLSYAAGVARNVVADRRREVRSRGRHVVPLSDAPETAFDDERLGRSEIEERWDHVREHLKPEELALLKNRVAGILAGRGEGGREPAGFTHAVACQIGRLFKKVLRLIEGFDRRQSGRLF